MLPHTLAESDSLQLAVFPFASSLATIRRYQALNGVAHELDHTAHGRPLQITTQDFSLCCKAHPLVVKRLLRFDTTVEEHQNVEFSMPLLIPQDPQDTCLKLFLGSFSLGFQRVQIDCLLIIHIVLLEKKVLLKNINYVLHTIPIPISTKLCQDNSSFFE